jgi:PST family polysaccharide transporter
VIELIAWLAPVGFLQSLSSPSGSVFMAVGRPDLLMKFGAVGMLLGVASFVIGVQWGVVGVAQCYFIASVINTSLVICGTMRILGQSPAKLLAALYRPCSIAFLMACCVYFLRTNVALLLPESAQLALFAGGALLYLALVPFGAPALARDVLKLLIKRPALVTQREGAL